VLRVRSVTRTLSGAPGRPPSSLPSPPAPSWAGPFAASPGATRRFQWPSGRSAGAPAWAVGATLPPNCSAASRRASVSASDRSAADPVCGDESARGTAGAAGGPLGRRERGDGETRTAPSASRGPRRSPPSPQPVAAWAEQHWPAKRQQAREDGPAGAAGRGAAAGAPPGARPERVRLPFRLLRLRPPASGRGSPAPVAAAPVPRLYEENPEVSRLLALLRLRLRLRLRSAPARRASGSGSGCSGSGAAGSGRCSGSTLRPCSRFHRRLSASVPPADCSAVLPPGVILRPLSRAVIRFTDFWITGALRSKGASRPEPTGAAAGVPEAARRRPAEERRSPARPRRRRGAAPLAAEDRLHLLDGAQHFQRRSARRLDLQGPSHRLARAAEVAGLQMSPGGLDQLLDRLLILADQRAQLAELVRGLGIVFQDRKEPPAIRLRLPVVARRAR
jgi:hypothetical protein